jgi:hypothetical protein
MKALFCSSTWQTQRSFTTRQTNMRRDGKRVGKEEVQVRALTKKRRGVFLENNFKCQLELNYFNKSYLI